jgi:hypothetical protein
MKPRIHLVCCCALALIASQVAPAAAQGYQGYPYSIMTPEPGTGGRNRASAAAPVRSPRASLLGREKFVAKLHRGPKVFVSHGSSGSVLPTPLPRTQAIPLEGEGEGVATVPALPHEQGPTFLPGRNNPIPNLPHGPETFQDRASRCAHQQGLYGVPGTASNQYMSAWIQ